MYRQGMAVFGSLAVTLTSVVRSHYAIPRTCGRKQPVIEGTYRKMARRAFLAATGISALVLGIFAILAGWQAFRYWAATTAHFCLRIWAAVPEILQIMLGISAAIGLISGGLWLLSAGKQWWITAGAVRSLGRKAVDPPPRVLTLLARRSLTHRVVVYHDAHALALTLGPIASRIMISTGLIETLDDNELDAVLLHEESHLRNRDPLYLLLARALVTAFFYLPVVGALVQRYQAAIELAADEYVIGKQGGSFSLSSAIVKLLRVRPSTAIATPFTGVADLRLSYLLERDVNLPGVSQWSVLQSAAAVAAIIVPVASIYGLAGMLNHIAFSRCIV